MQTRNRNAFQTIHTEGALLPVDLLQRVRDHDSGLEGLSPERYLLAPGEKLNEAINRSWNRMSGLWEPFQAARGRLGPADPGTTLTRERWLLPLFQELGFGSLHTARAVEIEGRSYPISHRVQNIPVHLVGCGLDLGRRTPGAAGAARVSPHSLLQEYLNRSEEAQWGLVSNGLTLRVLRDNAALTRQAYLEFDLESLFTGEVYSDFVLLWLMGHYSRFETRENEAECILERWSKTAQDLGTRALDDLRSGVEKAIVSLGQGFLKHPLNHGLRTRLKQGDLNTQDYYRQLLRLVYRLIFLFTAEDRDLLAPPGANPEAVRRFRVYYSTARLRTLALRQRGSRHHDRYEALRLVMNLLGSDQGCPELALPALGGLLFDERFSADLNGALLDNHALLDAVRSLAYIEDGKTSRAVDFRNLGSEELGSVYESLLELHPELNIEGGLFALQTAAGNERKQTGSYYTPSGLIRVLLDSALDPVIEARLRGKTGLSEQEQALLGLKVIDPACGSGHFLIAAAHRIAGRLAQARAGGDEPAPEDTRRALRDVIRACIYGVDLNPMAVELCKVNLWLESLEPGKPLSFLDAHIRCGNSLVGVGPKMDLDGLEVPDEAFNPVTGDHKPAASLLKKRNKQEREGQESLFVAVLKTHENLDAWLAARARALEAMPENSAAEVQAKAAAYRQVGASDQYHRQRQAADLWTAAFFWPIREPAGKALEVSAPTQGQLRRLRSDGAVQPGLLDEVERLRGAVNFFHWPLEFPEVAARGGFDCSLGNPPWERIKLQEEEFFAQRDPQIAAAPNKAERQKLIDALAATNPALGQDFADAKHAAEGSSKFMRASRRFGLTAVGDVNTYALFAEHSRDLMSAAGQAGIIVPTGIATDDTTKDFFGDLVEKRSIASLFDFENREKLFPAVDSRMKFSLLTLSGAPVKAAQFTFFATRVEHLRDPRRRFSLDPAEIALFNPNTRTMPVFRTRADAELTRMIYQRVPVLVNERTDENPWGVKFLAMFHMSNDSGLFAAEPREGYVRLYEAKMFHQYDHRWATYEGVNVKDVAIYEKVENKFFVRPRYWVPNSEVENRLRNFQLNWLIAFRDIARSTDERTAIFSVIPRVAVGHKAPLIFSKSSLIHLICLLGSFDCLIFDMITRQKIGGTSLAYFTLKQLPTLLPSNYESQSIRYIVSRVLELSFTAYDLQPFAQDVLDEIGPETWNAWYPHTPLTAPHSPPPPFPWSDERRAVIRAELDAYYARLYGLNRKQLRYILDPADLTPRELADILDPWEEVRDPLEPAGYEQRRAASDFPGETFRVLKDKEYRQYGEYRTRRLVLEAWEKEASGGEGARNPGELTGSLSAQPPVEVVYPPPVEAKTERPVRETAPALEPQPMLVDWTKYKCAACGKMVLGYDKEIHEKEKHGGLTVEWRKVK